MDDTSNPQQTKEKINKIIGELSPVAKVAPAYGEPQRDAINSIVDGILQDLIGKVHDLIRQLHDIEQGAIESAAASKERLQSHVMLCIKATEEVNRLADVTGRMRDGLRTGEPMATEPPKIFRR